MNARVGTTVLCLEQLSAEALSSVFTEVDLADARNVRGRYELAACDDVTFVRATTTGGLFHAARRAPHVKRMPCDSYFLCLPLLGKAMLSQHGRDCSLLPGDFGLLDAQGPYEIEISSGCDALWVRLPRQRLDWPCSATQSLAAKRIEGGSGTGLLTSRYIRTLFDQLPSVPPTSRLALTAVMIDLVGEAAAITVREARPFRSTGRRTLERARIFIERHVGEDDLSPARIAAGVGISPRYLSDLFAGDGLTTMRHVTSRRLERCRDALARETWRSGLITQPVFEHGFVNLSSFNRLFKDTYGVTPRQIMGGAGKPANLLTRGRACARRAQAVCFAGKVRSAAAGYGRTGRRRPVGAQPAGGWAERWKGGECVRYKK